MPFIAETTTTTFGAARRTCATAIRIASALPTATPPNLNTSGRTAFMSGRSIGDANGVAGSAPLTADEHHRRFNGYIL